MKLFLASAVLNVLIFSKSVLSLEIRRISDRIPEDAYARRVRVAGTNSDCFVYEGDVQYQYNGTDHTDFGDGIKKIWKTCNVFDDTVDKTHTLLSTFGTGEADDDAPAISDDGTKICYHTKDLWGVSHIAVVDTTIMTIQYLGRQLGENHETRKSTYCDMSPDGGSITFQSTAQLIPGGTNPDIQYKNYVTNNNGKTFTSPVGLDMINSGIRFLSSYPKLSNKGKFMTFQAKIPKNGVTPTINELYLYSRRTQKLEQLTDFQANKCDLLKIYEGMKAEYGEDNLIAEGVTKAISTSCNLGPTLGWQIDGKNMVGTNLLGAGHGPAQMDNDGRFIAYTAGFAHANTGNSNRTVTAANLFLRDNNLGLIWQITDEGEFGKMEEHVEEFCCPSASASSQRGTCPKRNEYKGLCCWQRPCWFPAQWPDISGDGTSIAFFSVSGPQATPADYEIHHYHIKSGTTTVITDTSDKDLDDTYPSISYKGDVIAFESDFDHTTGESIVQNNQVFAAKLSYGCSQNMVATNYHINPDIEETCKFDESLVMNPAFTGWGIKVGFAFNKDELMENVPFRTYDRKDFVRFCTSFIASLQEDLAFVMNLPISFLKVSKRSKWSCMDPERTRLEFDFAFYNTNLLDSADTWYGTLESSMYLTKNYLLKEADAIDSIKDLKEKHYS